MAKGNLILGTGSGSIGCITMMRRNGAEVARVRLRKIKNPKSQGQAEQRMYMAPILKFYSPLSKVLETSFEGLNKADSYAKFISVNANLARANGWAVTKGSGIVALPYQIANGTLPTPSVKFQDGEERLQLLIGDYQRPAGADTDTWGAVSSAIIAKYGLQNGDQLTFIQLMAPIDGEGQPTLVYKRIFLDTTSADECPFATDKKSSEVGLYWDTNDGIAVSMGVIFSRWENDAWRRSPSAMVCTAEYLANYTGATNLVTAIASYMKGAGQTPVSDVYLNGSDE